MGFSECIAKHGVFLLERGNPLNPPYQGDFNATVIRGTLMLRLAAGSDSEVAFAFVVEGVEDFCPEVFFCPAVDVALGGFEHVGDLFCVTGVGGEDACGDCDADVCFCFAFVCHVGILM